MHTGSGPFPCKPDHHTGASPTALSVRSLRPKNGQWGTCPHIPGHFPAPRVPPLQGWKSWGHSTRGVAPGYRVAPFHGRQNPPPRPNAKTQRQDPTPRPNAKTQRQNPTPKPNAKIQRQDPTPRPSFTETAIFRPKGAAHASPGQRPGNRSQQNLKP